MFKTQKHLIVFLAASCLISLSLISSSASVKKKKPIPASKQRSGNPEKGFQYLINGNYVSSGIPYSLYKNFAPKDSQNHLGRTGEARFIPPQFNLIEHENGTPVVSPNCLTCHSDYLNGEFIVGLGNNSFDYRIETQNLTNMLSVLIENKYGPESKENESFRNFYKAGNALQNNLKTEVRGINPADKLTAVLVAHRDPHSLRWHDEAQLKIPSATVPTDVPAWWLLKKKNAMFYTAIGRGDFSKFLMASSILTLTDTTEAIEIDKHFPDVLAWINSLEAPPYPESVDSLLARTGERLFELNCSGCHGTYGEQSTYPNYLIDLSVIGTDPYLSKAYTDTLYRDFIEWYEDSWFANSKPSGKIVVEPGYVAPPLDGVWATAPYLHNASVPDIESLLNSAERPKYWKRSYDNKDYNFDRLGWNYEITDTFPDSEYYNTDLDGYGNQGHYFGDDLSNSERKAIIEYLKTI